MKKVGFQRHKWTTIFCTFFEMYGRAVEITKESQSMSKGQKGKRGHGYGLRDPHSWKPGKPLRKKDRWSVLMSHRRRWAAVCRRVSAVSMDVVPHL